MSDNDFTRMYLIAEPWMRAFLLLTRTLGLRKSEALNAKPRDIALDTNRLTFRRKHEGSSNLPLTPELQSLFQYAATHDPDAPLVQTLAQRKVCQQFFYRHWWALKRRAAVDPNIIPHDLRRTAASRVYEQTRDLRIAQKLLGHRNLEATLHYLGPLDTGHLKQAIIDAAPVNLDTLPLPTEVKQ